MPSPILALQHNITYAFENPNGSAVEQLRRAVEEGRISRELGLDLSPGRPQAPRVVRPNGGPPTLELQAVHLELLWAFIYGWMVLYERGVQRPMLDGNFEGRIYFDTPLKERAAHLLDWVASLKNGHTEWPEGLHSPVYHQDEDERDCP